MRRLVIILAVVPMLWSGLTHTVQASAKEELNYQAPYITVCQEQQLQEITGCDTSVNTMKAEPRKSLIQVVLELFI